MKLKKSEKMIGFSAVKLKREPVSVGACRLFYV